MPARPIAQKVTIATTSTGNFGTVDFGTGMSSVTCIYTMTGSTRNTSFQMQGGIGASTNFTNLNAAATTMSTAAAPVIVNSTVAMTFDKVRVNVPANNFTSTEASTRSGILHLLAR